ncbi:MAG: FAD-dependent thymidylate synthase [Candidatus Margulisbacteria bacterium]|nr:FAD-dependent thymidylate synthase [Candidatus Margulisiibacteriota bacterium]MBU1021351.1 FAD-dependent thymidylate synthase [Candidatus Margulisiibacteriota bacterium]MBU1729160.1 FAD-dependent thymidylate synthase [Candidatus Margulisiibacteriota bacterium]MBU1954833.1 FAD-dependent thymidylate synthase [Candidatus Margulisiibacteriota bacterium]
MKIILSGYNVDTDVLEELKKNSPPRSDVTPETLSAAYARISRDPRPVDELRAVSRKEVESTRKSNSTIIFKMGHHSVAEHAVFNFDIIGVSRLAMEYLERFRLGSYTEKSQRYITLGDDFVIPEEFKGADLENDFVGIIKKQNVMYHELFEELKKLVFKKHSSLAAHPKNNSLLEGWAKEDARYVTSLATFGQLGMTINARNLEYLFRRFASQSLKEVSAIGKKMYGLVEKIAPSIILFAAANDFDQKTYGELESYVSREMNIKPEPVSSNRVSLVDYSANADEKVLAALLHSISGFSYAESFAKAKKLGGKQKEEIFNKTFQYMELYDSVLREFEFVNLTYELVISAACFAQLKRHRMATITTQNYDPALGVVIPDSIKELGKEKAFMEIINETNEVYAKLAKKNAQAAQYVLTNAHQRRVLIRVNARELYHVARLREDTHAQWDIQRISAQMSAKAREKMPLLAALLCGKDKYPEMYAKIFKKPPKVIL